MSNNDLGQAIFYLLASVSIAFLILSAPAEQPVIGLYDGIVTSKTAADGIYKITFTTDKVEAGYLTRQVTQPVYDAVVPNEQYEFVTEDGVITEVRKPYDNFL